MTSLKLTPNTQLTTKTQNIFSNITLNPNTIKPIFKLSNNQPTTITQPKLNTNIFSKLPPKTIDNSTQTINQLNQQLKTHQPLGKTFKQTQQHFKFSTLPNNIPKKKYYIDKEIIVKIIKDELQRYMNTPAATTLPAETTCLSISSTVQFSYQPQKPAIEPSANIYPTAKSTEQKRKKKMKKKQKQKQKSEKQSLQIPQEHQQMSKCEEIINQIYEIVDKLPKDLEYLWRETVQPGLHKLNSHQLISQIERILMEKRLWNIKMEKQDEFYKEDQPYQECQHDENYSQEYPDEYEDEYVDEYEDECEDEY